MAEKIKSSRRISFKEIAQKIGYDPSYFSQIRNGLVDVSKTDIETRLLNEFPDVFGGSSLVKPAGVSLDQFRMEVLESLGAIALQLGRMEADQKHLRSNTEALLRGQKAKGR